MANDERSRPERTTLAGVFERFTERARRVMVLAQEEARLLNHRFIGTEHLLLGLIREGDGIAAQALGHLGISLDLARAHVEKTMVPTPAPDGPPPFTPRAKKVLEFSLREALQLGHNYIGTEHILLGLVRVDDSRGAQVLIDLGADLARVRQVVMGILSGVEPLGRSATAAVPLLSAAEERVLGEAVVRGRQAEDTLRTLPPNTTEEREALVRAVGEGDEAQTRLVEGTIHNLLDAARLRAGRDTGQLDRLLAIGSTGLVTAARHYDPSRGFRFAVYAAWWIHRALDQRPGDPPALEVIEVGDRACSFCGRHRTEVAVMVAHHGEAICEQCVDVFVLELLGGAQLGKRRYEAARSGVIVRCPHCRGPLADNIVTQRLSIQGDDEHDLLAVSCGWCGTLISGTAAPTS